MSQRLTLSREHFEQKVWLTRADLVETVKLYQSYQYDINQSANIDKQTPLHIAAEEDKYTLMQILLAVGARADMKDRPATTHSTSSRGRARAKTQMTNSRRW